VILSVRCSNRNHTGTRHELARVGLPDDAGDGQVELVANSMVCDACRRRWERARAKLVDQDVADPRPEEA
jgi:hypothetical protein